VGIYVLAIGVDKLDMETMWSCRRGLPWVGHVRESHTDPILRPGTAGALAVLLGTGNPRNTCRSTGGPHEVDLSFFSVPCDNQVHRYGVFTL